MPVRPSSSGVRAKTWDLWSSDSGESPQLIGTSGEGEGVGVSGEEGLLSREIVAPSGASSWKDPRLVSR